MQDWQQTENISVQGEFTSKITSWLMSKCLNQVQFIYEKNLLDAKCFKFDPLVDSDDEEAVLTFAQDAGVFYVDLHCACVSCQTAKKHI